MSQTQVVDEPIPSPAFPTPPRRPWTVLSSSTFRKLWAATTLSLFGDFFSYIAMAWLVLHLTGSALPLASLLGVQALPRPAPLSVGGPLPAPSSPPPATLWSM